MRLFIIMWLSIIAFIPLHAIERVSASAKLLPRTVAIGDMPYVIVKFQNTSKSTLFVDDNEIFINHGVTYADESIDFSPILGPPIYMATDGARVGNVHLGNQTTGILPGQSILKLIQLPKIRQTGRILISIRINITATTDPLASEEHWTREELKTDFLAHVR